MRIPYEKEEPEIEGVPESEFDLDRNKIPGWSFVK